MYLMLIYQGDSVDVCNRVSGGFSCQIRVAARLIVIL